MKQIIPGRHGNGRARRKKTPDPEPEAGPRHALSSGEGKLAGMLLHTPTNRSPRSNDERLASRFAGLAGLNGLSPALGDVFLPELFGHRIARTLAIHGLDHEEPSPPENKFRLLQRAMRERRYLACFIAPRIFSARLSGHKNAL